MKKVVIGTENKGKQKEYLHIIRRLSDTNIQFLFPQDIGLNDKPEETGKTFEENANIKARFYYQLSKLPSIGDDGGLEIPILNNEPGVISRRWKGYEMTDKEIIDYTLFRLKNFKKKAQRKAFLEVVLVYFDGKKTVITKNLINGYIAEKPLDNWTKGYPFRALFIVKGPNKYYDLLTEEEHEKYNHRLKAFVKIVKAIKS